MIVTKSNLEGLVKTNLVRVSIETSLDGMNHTNLINSVQLCKDKLLEEYPEVIGLEHYSQEFISKIYKSISHTLYSAGFTPNQEKINRSFDYLMNKDHEYKVFCEALVEMMSSEYPEYYEYTIRELLEDSDIDDPELEYENILRTKCVGFSTREECVKFAQELIEKEYAYGVLIYKSEGGTSNTYDGCVIRWEE